MLRRMLSRERASQRGEHEMDSVKKDNLLTWSHGPDVSDDEGVCDDDEAVITPDTPPPDEECVYDSLEMGLEDHITVRICKDEIRRNLMELGRSMKHGSTLLEDIEVGTLKGCEAVGSVSNNNLLLLWGAFLGRKDLVQAALDAGASVHFYEPRGGLGALHLSANSGAVECTQILLKNGADPKYAEKGFSPLRCAIAGNAVATAKILLRAGAPATEPDLLHAAVRSNAVECVQLLLLEKADTEGRNKTGSCAIHIAADVGSVECLGLLLDNNADATAVTEKGSTPLHLAAEGGHVQCVDKLLTHFKSTASTAAEAKDCRGRTPLHHAARSQSVECAKLLLRKGSADPNAKDANSKTPLHAAVGRRALFALEMVELLIKWQADVNAEDEYGYTALHIAALNELTPCVDALLTNGADVSARTRGGTSALSIIARKTPGSLDTLSKTLDAAISMHDPEASLREVELKLDFRQILQHSKIGETGFLKTFVDEGDQNIFLEHPLCQAFLHLKWLKIRKFYVGRMISWAVLTILLSVYVLANYIPQYTEAAEKGTDSVILLVITYTPVKIQWWILLVVTTGEALRKLHALAGYASLRHYITQRDVILEWVVLVSVPLMVAYAHESDKVWQRHVGAFSVLAAWTNLMLLIGQLPLFGTYVAMYTRVQAEVTKLLIAYSGLLIGFTISFCVMFPNEEMFTTPVIGVIKVLVMMTGELDFGNLFENDREGESPYPMNVSAHIIFALFLLFVTTALMNLMVGIAVQDIQGLHKTAALSKLVSQATLNSHIELALFNGYLPTAAKRLLKKSAFVSPSGYRVVMHVKPLNPREKRLPQPILQAAYAVAMRRRRGGCTTPSIYTGLLARPSMMRKSGYSAATAAFTLDADGTLSELLREMQEIKEALKDQKTLITMMAAQLVATRPVTRPKTPENDQPADKDHLPQYPSANL